MNFCCSSFFAEVNVMLPIFNLLKLFNFFCSPDFLFFTDWRLQGLLRVDKTSGFGMLKVHNETKERLFGVKVFSEIQQPIMCTFLMTFNYNSD